MPLEDGNDTLSDTQHRQNMLLQQLSFLMVHGNGFFVILIGTYIIVVNVVPDEIMRFSSIFSIESF